MADLHDAARAGDTSRVLRLLAGHADPAALDASGLTPLHIAATVGHPAAWPVAAGTLDLDLLCAIARPAAEAQMAHVAIARALVEAAAPIDARAGVAAVTPLMLARYVGAGELAAALLAAGANPALRDAWGRTPDRLAVFATYARLIRTCSRLTMVTAVHAGQVLAWTDQVTSPLAGLTLSAALPGDALQGWPADEPVVVMATGTDALSRLLQLSPPLYTRPASTHAHEVAVAIASALGGEVRAIPTDGSRVELAVAVPGGALPLRVYEQVSHVAAEEGHTSAGIQLVTQQLWSIRDVADLAPVVAEIAAATRAWAAEHGDQVTALELALDAATTLSLEYGAPFHVTASAPPHTMVVRAEAIAASRLEITTRPGTQGPVRTRATLVRDRWAAVADVREQIAAVRLGRELVQLGRARVHAVHAALVAAGIAPPAGAWHVNEHVASTELSWSDARRAYVVLQAHEERGAVVAHAGLRGVRTADGWDGDLADLPAALPAVTAAIQRQCAALTVDRLVVGQRYRVRETLPPLTAGALVTYGGLDDIDNHHGKFDFTAEDGSPLAIYCDPSSPDFSALGDTGRYLEEV